MDTKNIFSSSPKKRLKFRPLDYTALIFSKNLIKIYVTQSQYKFKHLSTYNCYR